jgi:tetratricopeptide (TPR) repeat protein
MNRTISAIGVLVGLFTLIVLVLGGILGYLGFGTYSDLKKELAKVEKVAEEAEETLSKVKPIVDKIAKYEKDINGIKEKYKNEFRNLSATEKPSEKTKEKLDELAKKLEFLEGVGVELKAEDYFNRGLDYYYKGEYKKAKEEFEKTIELDPESVAAWMNGGVALGKLGNRAIPLTTTAAIL